MEIKLYDNKLYTQEEFVQLINDKDTSFGDILYYTKEVPYEEIIKLRGNKNYSHIEEYSIKDINIYNHGIKQCLIAAFFGLDSIDQNGNSKIKDNKGRDVIIKDGIVNQLDTVARIKTIEEVFNKYKYFLPINPPYKDMKSALCWNDGAIEINIIYSINKNNIEDNISRHPNMCPYITHFIGFVQVKILNKNLITKIYGY